MHPTYTSDRPHTLTSRAPRRSRLRQGEAGSTSIEIVVILPVLFGLIFAGVQVALIHHARSIALSAAAQGARAAGAESGTAPAGEAAARAYLEAVGGDALTATTAHGDRDAAEASVTVSGTALSVIPGWEPRVEQSSTVPVERLTVIPPELAGIEGGSP
ncbi:hypothetical protein GCM10028784_29880 [Myceligenerans cantabricum]